MDRRKHPRYCVNGGGAEVRQSGVDVPICARLNDISLGGCYLETRSPLNPLGLKGVGESATLPAPAVIASAVDDALSALGITVTESPLPPERVRALIARATQG